MEKESFNEKNNSRYLLRFPKEMYDVLKEMANTIPEASIASLIRDAIREKYIHPKYY